QKNCASKIFSRVVIIATTMKTISLHLNCGRYDTGMSVNELVVDHNIHNMKKNERKPMTQRILLSVAIVALAILPISCATRGAVKRECTRIDQEMTGLQTSVENTETRLKEQDSKLASHDQSIAQLSTESKEALDRAESAQKLAQGKLLYEVTLS